MATVISIQIETTMGCQIQLSVPWMEADCYWLVLCPWESPLAFDHGHSGL
jgi:hypothetical protein